MHVVMTKDRETLLICKKKEIPELFSNEFWRLYKVWWYFHNGLGFPGGKNYTEYDPDFVDIILAMESHYKRNFSTSKVMIEYMEALLRRR